MRRAKDTNNLQLFKNRLFFAELGHNSRQRVIAPPPVIRLRQSLRPVTMLPREHADMISVPDRRESVQQARALAVEKHRAQHQDAIERARMQSTSALEVVSMGRGVSLLFRLDCLLVF